MADFNVITGYPVATGAAITGPADVDALRAAGVTAVIDCQREQDDSVLLATSGWPYLWDGRDDDGHNGPQFDPWWEAGLRFAVSILNPMMLWTPGRKLLANPPPIIYAHCAAGHNRGPSMCYAILRAVLKLDAVAAEAVIRKARPVVELAYMADFERYWSARPS